MKRETNVKKLPSSKFGELLQCIYDCEHDFSIEWMWDGGFDWSFGCSFSGFTKPHESTTTLAQCSDNTDIEVIGGLIIHEYMLNFNGLDSEGLPNKMHDFLKENGFIATKNRQ